MIAAKATLRANDIQLPVLGLTVWNGYGGDGAGGTADAVTVWCRANIKTYAIHPTDPSRDSAVCDTTNVIAVPFERTQTALPKGYRQGVRRAAHLFRKLFQHAGTRLSPISGAGSLLRLHS